MKTTLQFNAARHTYTLDGKPVPGVTTLLGKGLAKPALPYWSAKMVAEYVVDNPEGVDTLRAMGRAPAIAALKSVPWDKRDQAAVRGTDIHHLAEELLHGREVDVPAHLTTFVDGYLHWVDAFNVTPVLTESRVASRSVHYAGTFDAIVTIGDRRLLLDWKTSNRVYGSTALQCAAYARADFYVDTNDEEQPIPEVDGIGVVHITETGTALHEFRSLEDAWKDWRHVAYVANAIPRIDAQLGDATPEPAKETAA